MNGLTDAGLRVFFVFCLFISKCRQTRLIKHVAKHPSAERTPFRKLSSGDHSENSGSSTCLLGYPSLPFAFLVLERSFLDTP